MSEFTNKRIVVMGLGRFGGGIGVTRWLHRAGARVTVTDVAGEAALKDSLAKIADLDVALHLGGHVETDLDGCDLLVASPAVDKRKSEFFKHAVARGIPWTSEMNLFLQRCPAKIVGITGSAGKSTTTAMTAAVCEAASRTSHWRHGRVWLGGNIGKSLLDDLTAMRSDDLVILELSSFQLEDAAALGKSPHIALVTNVRDNHLDRHGTLTEYAAAKANIYKWQNTSDWLIVSDDGGAEHLPGLADCAARCVRIGIDYRRRETLVPSQTNPSGPRERVRFEMSLPGGHNLANSAGALAIARLLGADDTTSVPVLNAFAGLPHRLEFIREHRGVRYYNDSKATSPEAAMTSMQAFEAPLIVLLGGSDKGSSYKTLGEYATRRAKAAVCYGQTGQAIRDAIVAAGGGAETVVCQTLGDAVGHTNRLSSDGDVVLLSPACASYDQFVNYEQRGDEFRRIVRAMN